MACFNATLFAHHYYHSNTEGVHIFSEDAYFTFGILELTKSLNLKESIIIVDSRSPFMYMLPSAALKKSGLHTPLSAIIQLNGYILKRSTHGDDLIQLMLLYSELSHTAHSSAKITFSEEKIISKICSGLSVSEVAIMSGRSYKTISCLKNSAILKTNLQRYLHLRKAWIAWCAAWPSISTMQSYNNMDL